MLTGLPPAVFSTTLVCSVSLLLNLRTCRICPSLLVAYVFYYSLMVDFLYFLLFLKTRDHSIWLPTLRSGLVTLTLRLVVLLAIFTWSFPALAPSVNLDSNLSTVWLSSSDSTLFSTLPISASDSLLPPLPPPPPTEIDDRRDFIYIRIFIVNGTKQHHLPLFKLFRQIPRMHCTGMGSWRY